MNMSITRNCTDTPKSHQIMFLKFYHYHDFYHCIATTTCYDHHHLPLMLQSSEMTQMGVPSEFGGLLWGEGGQGVDLLGRSVFPRKSIKLLRSYGSSHGHLLFERLSMMEVDSKIDCAANNVR